MNRPVFVFFAIARFSSLLLLGVLLGCRRSEPTVEMASPESSLTPIVLQTDWFAQAEHGGFYAALLNGHYAAAGLAVEIRQGGPNAHTLQRVAVGEAQFSMHRSDDIIVQISQGMPLLITGVIMQRDPQALMFHAESGIADFRDLNGRAIMATPGLIYLEVLRRTFGLEFSVIPHNYGMEQFIADPNFVQQCFITNEPFFVERAGIKVKTLLIADSGFSPYQVWYTRKDFAARHPDLVRAFNAATIQGWQDYLFGDPSAIHAEILRRNPRTNLELLEYSRAQIIERKLVTGPHGGKDAIGTIDARRLQRQIEQLSEIGLLASPVGLSDLYDSALISVSVE